MPTWKVKGADRATGADRSEKIVAEDRRAAELQLKKLGILVESMEEDNSKTIDYAAAGMVAKNPPAPPAPPAIDADGIPLYQPIVQGSNNLAVWAGVCRVFAGLSIIFGVIAAVAAGQGGTAEAVFAAIISGIVGLVIFGTCAVLLNLIASLSLAVRDAARNSFRIGGRSAASPEVK